MRYRYEYKYLISSQTADIFRGRISTIMRPDSHSDGKYTVNNLYLDDMYDSFYHAKYFGQLQRDKFRLRYYNDDMTFIRLERKHKDGIVSYKETIQITEEQYFMVRAGDFRFIDNEKAQLWKQLGVLNRLRCLRPTAEYAYWREVYVYEPGNIRFTFDSPPFTLNGERLHSYDPRISTYGAEEYSPLMLEVKYTGFMPEIIKRLINGLPLAHTGISKYNVVRERGHLPHGSLQFLTRVNSGSAVSIS